MTRKPVWRECLEAIAIALALALFIKTFIVQAYQIPSGSMLNTLLIGDRILVNKFCYGVRVPFVGSTLIEVGDPQFGDIIVFAYPEDEDVDYIKRVIGMPGDTIEIRNKAVYRNGVKLDEPYVRYRDQGYFIEKRDNYPPTKVPADRYFVMGDNRDDSKDSRFWGFVRRDAIHGKAWRIYWSNGSKPGDAGSSGFKDEGVRWQRLGSLVR